jgi:phage FluMu protein Com
MSLSNYAKPCVCGADGSDTSGIRCHCNRLLAKINGCFLELHCSRCKRKMVIDFTGIADSDQILKRIRYE